MASIGSMVKQGDVGGGRCGREGPYNEGEAEDGSDFSWGEMTGSFRFTSSDPAWILEALARSPLDARRDLRRAPDSAQTENHEDGESGIVGGTTGVVGRRIVSACLGRVASVS